MTSSCTKSSRDPGVGRGVGLVEALDRKLWRELKLFNQLGVTRGQIGIADS